MSRQPHRRISYCLVIAVAMACATATWALQPNHEADRLLLAAEDAFANNNRGLAAEHLQAARQLGIALPAEYNFLYGKLLQQQNKASESRTYLERYVASEGNNGRFYRDALALITQIEKQNQPRPQPVARTSNSTAQITRADGSEGSYGEKIQTLYNAETVREGLTVHLNNLLKFYAVGDERVVASTRTNKPSRHKIQYSSGGEIISFNQLGLGANAPFKEDRFSVYGVNPIISYQCRAATSSCWLFHPVTSQKWLQVVRNEDIALEISKAMSTLIKDLQKNT